MGEYKGSFTEKEKKVWEKIIRLGLREIDYLNEDWNSYFEKKKQEIREREKKSFEKNNPKTIY